MKRVIVPGLFVPAALLTSASLAVTPYPLLTDNFSRNTTPANTPVGTPPTRDVNASTTGWVSDWGQNNNHAGGKITQTYTTYLDTSGNPFKIDGTSSISGNWLNNGSAAHPLKINNSGATITEPIGIPGFAWVQVNHDFAANRAVTSGDKFRVKFDLYRTPGGNVSWYIGNADPTGVNNGNAGSPVLNTQNDLGLLWRGFQSSTFSLFDSGADQLGSAAYAGGTNVNAMPIPIVIEISGTQWSAGQNSTVEMWVAGVKQDLNGAAAGEARSLAWDGGAVFMGFGSNSSPVEGTIAAPVFRASGIDNLAVEIDLLLGDMNKDGAVNNLDIAPFVLGLTSAEGYATQFPTLDASVLGDVNMDGAFNNLDIAPFVGLLTGGRPIPLDDPAFAPLLSVVPEPAALSLLVLGSLTLRRQRRRSA